MRRFVEVSLQVQDEDIFAHLPLCYELHLYFELLDIFDSFSLGYGPKGEGAIGNVNKVLLFLAAVYLIVVEMRELFNLDFLLFPQGLSLLL